MFSVNGRLSFRNVSNTDTVFFKPPLIDFQGVACRYRRNMVHGDLEGNHLLNTDDPIVTLIKAMESGIWVSFIQNVRISGSAGIEQHAPVRRRLRASGKDRRIEFRVSWQVR